MDAADAKWIAVSTMSFASRRPALGRALAAGDAAASIAPLLGEGMAFALESGELAGEAWHGVLGGAPEERVRADYVRAWTGLARRRLALGRVLQAMLLEPRGAALGVRCLEIAPGLGDWISGTSL
jgi:flavin-dependent dehydrogenase